MRIFAFFPFLANALPQIIYYTITLFKIRTQYFLRVFFLLFLFFLSIFCYIYCPEKRLDQCFFFFLFLFKFLLFKTLTFKKFLTDTTIFDLDLHTFAKTNNRLVIE